MTIKTLFNHVGFCIYSNTSRYQSTDEPVGLAQVHDYVDEVAAAGIDALALCPNMYQLPGWDSDHYPYWRGEAQAWDYPDTAVGRVISRCREFILGGNDLIQLSLERGANGVSFFNFTYYRDYSVPLMHIQKGWNTVELALSSGPSVSIDRIELALT